MGKSEFHRREKIAMSKGYVVLEDGTVNGPLKDNIGFIHQKYHTFKIRCNGGENRSIKTHRLQALQKFGDKIYEEGMVVRHLNNDCTDNSFANIGIGTERENHMDIPREERVRRAIHATSFVKKYDHEDVIEFYNKCKSYTKTMEKFDITSKGTLHYILRKNPKDYKVYEEL